jgi:hypothetical protein
MNHAKSEFLTLLNSRTDLFDPTNIFELDALSNIRIYVYYCLISDSVGENQQFIYGLFNATVSR